jgi:hypothetical protein
MQATEDVTMPCTTLTSPSPRFGHRVTASPRLRRHGGALWLGLGLCFVTLFVLRHADPR